jgi:hypothetical protein
MNPTKAILSFAIISIALSGYSTVADPAVKEPPAGMKIGTYDSRAVVLAYSRSALFQEHFKKMQEESKQNLEGTDTVKMKEAAYKMITFQYLLHQQVFCAGSVASIMNLVKDKLPEVAKKAGVSTIVSKWELTYSEPSIEVTDLTAEICSLFNPVNLDQQTMKEISNQAPIPLEDFTVEEVIEMWKSFETKNKK